MFYTSRYKNRMSDELINRYRANSLTRYSAAEINAALDECVKAESELVAVSAEAATLIAPYDVFNGEPELGYLSYSGKAPTWVSVIHELLQKDTCAYPTGNGTGEHFPVAGWLKDAAKMRTRMKKLQAAIAGARCPKAA